MKIREMCYLQIIIKKRNYENIISIKKIMLLQYLTFIFQIRNCFRAGSAISNYFKYFKISDSNNCTIVINIAIQTSD